MNTTIAIKHAGPPNQERRRAARKKRVNCCCFCIAAAAIFAGAFSLRASSRAEAPTTTDLPAAALHSEQSASSKTMSIDTIRASEASERAIVYGASEQATIGEMSEEAIESRTSEPEMRSMLGSVPLDEGTQMRIYDLCENDDSLFCAVMAIANIESGFDVSASDGGNCIGMMQINTKWHTARIESLGITDLTDPVQCAAVAIDYIRELEGIFGVGPESHTLYMAYSMGPTGARDAITAGTCSTAYSRQVMADYEAYLTEFGG